MENTNIVSTFAHHDDILDLLRDVWPQIRGANILWFQNDIFHKLRLLETKAGCEGRPVGFLPASFCSFTNIKSVDEWPSETDLWSADYKGVWNSLFAEIDSAVTADSLLEAIDELEEDVCNWVQDMIPADYNFFIAALDEGILNAEWLDKAQLFLEKAVADDALNQKSDETIPTIKEVIKKRQHTRRRLINLPLMFSSAPVSKRRFRLTRRK